MNIEETFPARYYINLSRREDRRFRMDLEFFKQGLDVRRQAAVNGRYVRHLRGYPSAGRAACAASQRMILRRAEQANAPAVLFFEDDAVFRPHFRERMRRLELPADWGIFYAGCIHVEKPEVVAPGLVRVKRALSTHAVAVRSAHYRTVRHKMGHATRSVRGAQAAPEMACDVLLAELHATIPTYAAWPNLVWQQAGKSDIAGLSYEPFDATGRQVWHPEAVAEVDAEMLAAFGPEAHPEVTVGSGRWAERRGLRLHIGGEGAVDAGWEVLPAAAVHDGTLDQLADGTVDAVCLDGVLETLSLQEALRTSETLRRITAPSGTLEVVTVNPERFTAQAPLPAGPYDERPHHALRSAISHGKVQTLWPAPLAIALLRAAGFADARETASRGAPERVVFEARR